MKKSYPHSSKSYRKRPFGDPKDKWDHGGYEALEREEKNEYFPHNYYFKKKREDPFQYRKDVILRLSFLILYLNFWLILFFRNKRN